MNHNVKGQLKTSEMDIDTVVYTVCSAFTSHLISRRRRV
jgi:hypothetical protein